MGYEAKQYLLTLNMLVKSMQEDVGNVALYTELNISKLKK